MLQVKTLEDKISLTSMQASVLEKLGRGHGNAIGLKDLVKRTAIPERQLRLVIESLRLEGYIIVFGQKQKVKNCTLPSGYYFDATRQEAEEFYQYMKGRVIAECRIMRSIKIAAVKKYTKSFGQLPLI